MGVVLVRQKVKDDSLQAAEAAARELFATLERVRPEGLRYASTRVRGSSAFVIVTGLAEGVEDRRPAVPRGSWGSWSGPRAGWTGRRWSSTWRSSAPIPHSQQP